MDIQLNDTDNLLIYLGVSIDATTFKRSEINGLQAAAFATLLPNQSDIPKAL